MNNFTHPPEGHTIILIRDIVVGLIVLVMITVICFFFIWVLEYNRVIFYNPKNMDTVKTNDRHINGSVLNYTETP